MDTIHATAADSASTSASALASTLPPTPAPAAPAAPAYGFTRLASIGYVLGLAAMAALFLHGLALREPGLTAVSSSTAALLGTVWASTTITRGRQARK
jgi:hypothetical protein